MFEEVLGSYTGYKDYECQKTGWEWGALVSDIVPHL